jgi:hypothetical protein
VFDFWSRPALERHQCRPQGHLQIKLLLGALGRVGQGVEHFQALAQMTDRFHIGGLRERSLPGPLPVDHGLDQQAGFRIVMHQQFGLGLGDLWKALR